MGGGEAGKPLHIPWTKMFDDRECPATELIVSASASSGDTTEVGDGCSFENFSDQLLLEAIDRYKHKTMSPTILSKLPDKGKKLRNRLRCLEEELDRRQKVVMCEKVVDHSRISPGLQNHHPRTSSEASFVDCFSRKMEVNNSCTAFNEELSFLNREKKKSKTVCNSGTSLKLSSYRCSSSLSRDARQISFNDKHRQKWPHLAKGCLTNIFHNSMRQVPQVVLLDEEDVQPTQQTFTSDELKEAKIYYPSRDHPECVEICFLDLKCLDPESYLSSTIMNFYIQYLQRLQSIIEKPRGEYHFFNTYFYKKLEALSSKVERNASFTKLRRWLRGVNIFQKSYLFLPIHGNQHWSLVVICIPAIEEECGPIILHLDSLRLHDSDEISDNIEIYLVEEWNYLIENSLFSEFPLSQRIWKNLPSTIVRKKIMVPQQENVYDCGLFVLYFVERFMEEAPERLRMKDLDMFGKKWFRSEEASGLRKRIRELLFKTFDRERLENNAKLQVSLRDTSSASSIEDDIFPFEIS